MNTNCLVKRDFRKTTKSNPDIDAQKNKISVITTLFMYCFIVIEEVLFKYKTKFF